MVVGILALVSTSFVVTAAETKQRGESEFIETSRNALALKNKHTQRKDSSEEFTEHHILWRTLRHSWSVTDFQKPFSSYLAASTDSTTRWSTKKRKRRVDSDTFLFTRPTQGDSNGRPSLQECL